MKRLIQHRVRTLALMVALVKLQASCAIVQDQFQYRLQITKKGVFWNEGRATGMQSELNIPT